MFVFLRNNDWCFREAHLELARREKLGGPLVSRDYVPVEKISLPSDEELGDFKITL
jgi:NADH dehydrogenase (ubiquinone) 1 beta subcomplex subunit 11